MVTQSEENPNRTDVSRRQHWMSVLAQASAPAIEKRLVSLSEGALPDFKYVRAPETGMVMTQGRAGGTGARFSAGEMTVTRCTIVLEDGTMGHAYVAGRDLRHAELAAVLDGALQTGSVAELSAAVIEPLAYEQRTRRERRSREAAATKVDFFTMVRGED